MKLSERMERVINLVSLDNGSLREVTLVGLLKDWVQEVEELEKSSKSMVVDYSKPDVSEGYVCSVCGATGCKMWKKFGFGQKDYSLLCTGCVTEKSGVPLESISDDGEVRTSFGMRAEVGEYGLAVPHDEEFHYFNDVPWEARDWWRQLPNVSDTK